MTSLTPGAEALITARALRVVAWQRAMRAAEALMEAYPGAVVKPVGLRPRPGGRERYGLAAELPGAAAVGDYGEVRAWLESAQAVRAGLASDGEPGRGPGGARPPDGLPWLTTSPGPWSPRWTMTS